jgi:peptidoglycan hydrolase-like protein with peptidoglycan-binding domain
MRRLVTAVVAVAAGLTGLALTTSSRPATADTRAMPGSFTGYAFDACQAPSQEAMDVWRERSPYWGVGIYTSGVNRYCDEQRHLSWSWVDEQARKGWVLLPLHVGLQAACTGTARWEKIDSDPADNYAAARAQGRAEAREAVEAARSYGIGPRSTLWYDLEHFDVSRDRCRESALSLVSAWTNTLHDLGYRSGFYSSAGSGIKMLDDARVHEPRRYSLPDQLWVARWSGTPFRINDAGNTYLRDDGWPRDRVHQYRGGHDETYGGVTVNIDSNFMHVGRGSRPGKAPAHCGVRIDFGTYPVRRRGDRGDHVAAGQCLLKKAGLYPRTVHGRFSPATERAVRRFQDATPGIRTTGVLDRRTWTALTSRGRAPVVKYGSASDAVRRLQRALNAADAARLDVDGVFANATAAAVKRYQRDHDLRGTGAVAGDVWALLQAGRR